MTTLDQKLAEHAFCAGLSPHHVAVLAGCAREVDFAAGVPLAREGQDADASYLICRGRVALRFGNRTVETVEPGQFLGWSWLFEGTTWHVDAVAVGAVNALRLDGQALDARMHAEPEFGHALARHILHAVHKRLERARLRSLDVFGEPS